MKNSFNFVLTVLLILSFLTFCNGLPVFGLYHENSSIYDDDDNIEYTVPENDSSKDLYVIKAVVYEIGILTNVSNENETSSETQERIDLTFFDAHRNDSHIDLGKIPLPVQTNVSGQVLTAIAPINIGAFSNPSELFDTLPLTGTIVNITQSDTSYFQLSAHNITTSDIEEVGPTLITADEIEKIPDVADVIPEINIDQM